ncbi:ribosomal protein L28e [Tothia fuscella]|uniref:Ribosomal protein L28e n=1 Tax=Tothia fuscella TaxID=1048955 RepID=A0A9P4NFM5_9PEZI|nr:ribosomal protein L28e [Tothia fuscella]
MSAEHIPADLLWQITRNYSALTVKRRPATAGGVQFSRDPLNLTNKHSRKYDGYINPQAIGITPGSNGGVNLLTKKSGKSNKPAGELQTASFGKGTTPRKTYRNIVNATTKRGYRPDLRHEAVARASAIRKSERAPKDTPARKARGVKAKKAAEKA